MDFDTDLDQTAAASPIRVRRRENESLRIVKAALSLFLERGLDPVTVDEIAEAASISRRTFFRYFPSKDDVLAVIHRRSMRRVAEAWRDRPLDEPFVTALVKASRTISEAEIDPDERAMSALSVRLLVRHPEAWERIVRQVGREIESELESVIASRRVRLSQDTEPAGVLAALAWTVGCAVFRQWLESGAKDGLTDRLEQALADIRAAL